MYTINLNGGNGQKIEAVVNLIESEIKTAFEIEFQSALKILLVQNSDGTFYGFFYFKGIEKYIKADDEGFWYPTEKLDYYTVSNNSNIPTAQDNLLKGVVVNRKDYV